MAAIDSAKIVVGHGQRQYDAHRMDCY